MLKIKVTAVKKHQTFKGLSFYLPIQASDWNEMPDVANISFEDKILLDDIDQRRSRSSVLVSPGGQTRNIFTRHMAGVAASGNTAVTPPTVHPPSLEQFLDTYVHLRNEISSVRFSFQINGGFVTTTTDTRHHTTPLSVWIMELHIIIYRGGHLLVRPCRYHRYCR